VLAIQRARPAQREFHFSDEWPFGGWFVRLSCDVEFHELAKMKAENAGAAPADDGGRAEDLAVAASYGRILNAVGALATFEIGGALTGMAGGNVGFWILNGKKGQGSGGRDLNRKAAEAAKGRGGRSAG
jgi:hypothetical protein